MVCDPNEKQTKHVTYIVCESNQVAHVRYPQYHIRAGKPCACSRLIPSPIGREGWANHVRRSKHSRAMVRSVLGVSSYSLVIDKQTTQLNHQNLLDIGNQESYISEHITYRNVS